MTLASLFERSRQEREAWRYTDLASLAAQDFVVANQDCVAGFPLPEPALWQRLVFVNGGYCPALSQQEGLPDGFFSCLESGDYAITLAAQTCLAPTPVELLFITSGEGQPQESTSRLRVTLGANARLTLIERHVTHGGAVKAHLVEATFDLARQAKLVHGKSVQGDSVSSHFSKTDTTLEDGAFYDHFCLIVGGKLTRCETDVALRGERAEAKLSGAMLLRGESHGALVSRVRHEVPCGTSRQICKAVLDDKAHGVFHGKIHVAKGAQKTDGHQVCRALLLSGQAEMDAKPELEIYADDVKCAHGTAIGDLDEDALFYLVSRGIEEKAARALLVEAFVGELVDQVQSPELVQMVRDEVSTWLA